MADDWQDAKLTFGVDAPTSMTIGVWREVGEMLREAGEVTSEDWTYDVVVPIAGVLSELGHCGPATWACDVVGLPESSEYDVQGDAARLLGAVALDEWWTELIGRLADLGATTTEPMLAVTGEQTK